MKSINFLLFLFILTSSAARSADISFFLQCEPDCFKTVIKTAEPSALNFQKNNDSVVSVNDFKAKYEKSFSTHEYSPPKKPKYESGPYIYKDNKGTDKTNVKGGWVDKIDNSSGIWHAYDNKDEGELTGNVKIKDNILEK